MVDVVFPSELTHDQQIVRKDGVDIPVLLKKLSEEDGWTEHVITHIVA